MSNPFRISGIPAYLEQVVNEMKESEKQHRLAQFNKEQKGMIKGGKVNRRWAQSNMSMINHGFGVMEDQGSGSVWYVEGDYLIRQDSDEDVEAIIASLT